MTKWYANRKGALTTTTTAPEFLSNFGGITLKRILAQSYKGHALFRIDIFLLLGMTRVRPTQY